MSEKIQIRNSTVDFLVFTRDAGDDGIEVRVQNNDVWLTQKAIAQLFDVDRSVVSKHLSNIFKLPSRYRTLKPSSRLRQITITPAALGTAAR